MKLEVFKKLFESWSKSVNEADPAQAPFAPPSDHMRARRVVKPPSPQKEPEQPTAADEQPPEQPPADIGPRCFSSKLVGKVEFQHMVGILTDLGYVQASYNVLKPAEACPVDLYEAIKNFQMDAFPKDKSQQDGIIGPNTVRALKISHSYGDPKEFVKINQAAKTQKKEQPTSTIDPDASQVTTPSKKTDEPQNKSQTVVGEYTNRDKPGWVKATGKLRYSMLDIYREDSDFFNAMDKIAKAAMRERGITPPEGKISDITQLQSKLGFPEPDGKFGPETFTTVALMFSKYGLNKNISESKKISYESTNSKGWASIIGEKLGLINENKIAGLDVNKWIDNRAPSKALKNAVSRLNRIGIKAKLPPSASRARDIRYDQSWKKDKPFLDEVQKFSKEHNIDPNALLGLMSHETGGTFSTAVENPKGYVGLVQMGSHRFKRPRPKSGRPATHHHPSTIEMAMGCKREYSPIKTKICKNLGYNGDAYEARDAFKRMSRVEQFELVKIYFTEIHKRPFEAAKKTKEGLTIDRLYSIVFQPAFASKPMTEILASLNPADFPKIKVGSTLSREAFDEKKKNAVEWLNGRARYKKWASNMENLEYSKPNQKGLSRFQTAAQNLANLERRTGRLTVKTMGAGIRSKIPRLAKLELFKGKPSPSQAIASAPTKAPSIDGGGKKALIIGDSQGAGSIGSSIEGALKKEGFATRRVAKGSAKFLHVHKGQKMSIWKQYEQATDSGKTQYDVVYIIGGGNEALFVDEKGTRSKELSQPDAKSEPRNAMAALKVLTDRIVNTQQNPKIVMVGLPPFPEEPWPKSHKVRNSEGKLVACNPDLEPGNPLRCKRTGSVKSGQGKRREKLNNLMKSEYANKEGFEYVDPRDVGLYPTKANSKDGVHFKGGTGSIVAPALAAAKSLLDPTAVAKSEKETPPSA